MDTKFASAARSSEAELRERINLVTQNPIIDCLMKSVSGLLAVLDENRQILSVNDTLLKAFGFKSAEDVFGLRLGEAIDCVHAYDEPSGCGTTEYCPTCGVAIAMVSSLGFNKPAERLCAATMKRNGGEVNRCFQVRSAPITLDKRRFLLIFMQDITDREAWASLEKTFFHDINNLMVGVVGAVDLLYKKDPGNEGVMDLRKSALRLRDEINIQAVLSTGKNRHYQVSLQDVSLRQVCEEIENVFASHPAAGGKSLVVSRTIPEKIFTTDCSLLYRVLTNMLKNAFEATSEGGEVKFWVDREGGDTSFFVWNQDVIPQDVRKRIFQKHFSTKEGEGRGMGTYSMKLLGEEFLKGKVSFTSSSDIGTVFRLTL